jgi:hypothetical protein
MISPSQPFDAQNACLLFTRLPVELRDQIYTLVFAVETSENGSIKLDGTTKLPNKALTMTCQRLHNETRAMYRAAYRSFPNHTFTVDMKIRPLPADIPRDLGNDIVLRINSLHVFWDANEYNKGAPLRLITSFDRDDPSQHFRTQVKLHDGDSYWRGRWMEVNAIRQYRDIARLVIHDFRRNCSKEPENSHSRSELLSYAILHAVFNVNREQQIWWGF